jgi:hypothetical protein
MYKKYKLENLYRKHYFSDPLMILKWNLNKEDVTGCGNMDISIRV